MNETNSLFSYSGFLEECLYMVELLQTAYNKNPIDTLTITSSLEQIKVFLLSQHENLMEHQNYCHQAFLSQLDTLQKRELELLELKNKTNIDKNEYTNDLKVFFYSNFCSYHFL